MKNDELFSQSPKYFHYYFELVDSSDLLLELEKDRVKTLEFFQKIPNELEHHAYQVGKWTVNQVVRHIIDTERIFNYRALRFARFDKTELLGFDENKYIEGMSKQRENLLDLIEEFDAVRRSTLSLFKSLSPEMRNSIGNANGQKYSVDAIGFLVIGHNMHHCKVLIERYLS